MLVGCLCLIVIGNIVNHNSEPPSSLFINYEMNIFKNMQVLIENINVRFGPKGVKFVISNNDVMWIEIFIPNKLQMPFSPYQINREV
jgi:hypothetical protein